MNVTDSPLAGAMAGAVDIRPLASEAEYQACVRLQRETWGAGYTDWVPVSMLRVTQHIGGLVAGAFNGETMIGFVYGVMGVLGGEIIHWSHMLAVSPPWRGRGIGRRLKQFQREALRGTAVRAICWTFDPLVASHGRRNLGRLGAEVRDYLLDAYPNTGSQLHAFGTDRLVVRWPVGEGAPAAAGGAAPAAGAPTPSNEARTPGPSVAPAAGAVSELGRVPVLNGARDDFLSGGAPPRVLIEVPADIEAVAARSLAGAQAWRAATRRAFTSALAARYRVQGFAEEDARCFYVLARGTEAGRAC